MKWILKLLLAPVVLILAVVVWLCSAVLYCSAFVFGLIATLIGILGLAVMVTYSVPNGLILLLIAFLVSPLGLPMLAVRMIGGLQKLRFCSKRKSCLGLTKTPGCEQHPGHK